MNQVAEQQQEPLRHDKLIEKARDRFMDTAPSGMNFEAEKGYAVQLLENNDYLMRAAMENPGSLLQAMTNVSAIGLSLNPAKKQAYLIPRTLKLNGQPVTKVFLEPSFVGMMDLATQSGSIKWVQANVVYEGDNFIDNGPGAKPTHEYKAFSKDRGEFVGVYCVAKTSEGDYLTTVMPADEVFSIRDRSEAYKRSGKGPWATDFNEMAKKSVIRRAFKQWPHTDSLERMALAVDLSNENEGFEPITSAPQTRGFTAEQKQYYDQLIEKNDALGMYLFAESIKDSGAWDALYNSFEKGTITKYKRMVDELYKRGCSLIHDIATAIEDSAGEDSVIAENLDDLPDEAVEMVMHRLSNEAAFAVNEFRKSGAQEAI